MQTQPVRRLQARVPHRALSWASALALALVSLALLLIAPSVAFALSSGPTFPRLAIWWPDSDAQPASARARCDWTALQSHDAGHIAELRALNPSIIVLASTNARELACRLDDYGNYLNVELRAASTDWMLTQVGSTLLQDVGASTPVIPVADAARFAAGEMVLVDHELASVVSVSRSSLTVTRGQVTPTAAHGAGVRIAPVVSNWPDSITMDLSVNCPRRDTGYGVETWSEWNARRGRAVLESANWDGLLIDALEGTPSWMVRVGNVGSIDENRDNVADDLSSFDASWNAGAGAFGDVLRAACGSRILIGNGNMRNFSLNGTVFETFPYAGLLSETWSKVFIGPFDYPWASYPEWCARAEAPNLTLVQTYGSPTNCRLMRYGLCSALLNDGYFSYALSDKGHAVNGLDWFDEYDNAGAGRGYLGQPTGPAVPVGGAWRRDYSGGVALVNPSDSEVTVQLGGDFRKINGTQDPAVNDGTTVSVVTIPSRDGIILLRIPPTQNVALRASRTTLSYGQETTLQVEASLAPDAAIRIEQRPAGSSLWQGAATTNTDDEGAAFLARRPLVTTEYRVVLVGSGAASKIVSVGVRPRVTLRASRTKVPRGRSAVLSGTVTHAGRISVRLQKLVGRTWRTVKRLVSSTSGKYSTTIVFPGRGTFAYRAYVTADASHLASVSGGVRITVR
jgi:hypothetical protein